MYAFDLVQATYGNSEASGFYVLALMRLQGPMQEVFS